MGNGGFVKTLNCLALKKAIFLRVQAHCRVRVGQHLCGEKFSFQP